MDFNLPAGKKYELGKIVEPVDTAKQYGSGLLEVLATPAMIAFMEQTCMELAGSELPEGYGTVGTAVNIKHLKASAVGAHIWCRATLTGSDNKRLEFTVEAGDDSGLIGSGTHTRYIINEVEFMAKLNAKR
jgi:predicted thioesterase